MPPKRILIVEDDEYLRKASEIALRRAGYTVQVASGGREGLHLARAERPDLIVLDLLMPHPTGLDVLRALKANKATRSIPVLVVSNSSMQRIVGEVEGHGAEYIVKANLSLRQLVDLVEARLAKEPPAPEPPAPPASEPVAPPAEAPKPAPVAPVVPEVAGAVAEESVTDALELGCAGCGFSIWTGFAFCPKCGRRLDKARSAIARFRGFR